MEPTPHVTSQTPPRHRLSGLWTKIVFPVAVLLLGVGGVLYQMGTSRTAEQQTVTRQAMAVEVMEVQHTDVQTVIHAMGTVVPAQIVTLKPRVAGQVTSLSEGMIPGGWVQAGEPLLQIDPRDYELALEQSHQAVAQARLDLKLEQGNQSIAQAEYGLLGDTLAQQDRELVLREPHLAQAQAAWQAAQATLAQAKLNLERCQITAPFNGLIQDKLVDLGATVSTSTDLLTLIGTDACWIEVTVRGDELQWIQLPGQERGSAVRVHDKSQWDANTDRTGSVLRLLPNLETEGRLVRLLVQVPDPFALNSPDQPRLLMGSYIRAEIQGRILEQVIPIPRDHLHNGQTVWIMNEDDRLETRSVEIVFRDPHQVYVTGGLESGERLIVTHIGTPVEGMQLDLTSPQASDTPTEEKPQ